MNIGSVPTVSSPFRKGHRLLVWRLRASGYALRPSSPHQQPILILIVAAFSSCLSPRSYGARVYVNRNHEPSLMPHYATHEIRDISGLPGVLGL